MRIEIVEAGVAPPPVGNWMLFLLTVFAEAWYSGQEEVCFRFPTFGLSAGLVPCPSREVPGLRRRMCMRSFSGGNLFVVAQLGSFHSAIQGFGGAARRCSVCLREVVDLLSGVEPSHTLYSHVPP